MIERIVNFLGALLSIASFLFALLGSDFTMTEVPRYDLGSMPFRIFFYVAIEGVFCWSFALATVYCLKFEGVGFLPTLLLVIVSAWQSAFFIVLVFYIDGFQTIWQIFGFWLCVAFSYVFYAFSLIHHEHQFIKTSENPVISGTILKIFFGTFIIIFMLAEIPVSIDVAPAIILVAKYAPILIFVGVGIHILRESL